MYEDALFESEVLRIVTEHPTADPLFLFWAPHIVHGPAQLPQAAFEALDFIEATDGPGARARQNYLGRVKYIDAAFGRLVALLKQRGMYENSVIAMSADNGGPVSSTRGAASARTHRSRALQLGSANNWPLKGGKHSNWSSPRSRIHPQPPLA